MGNGTGCSNLGLNYLEGVGAPKDPRKAVKYLNQACSLGEQEGCDKLKEISR